jgi:hypothetical protein
MRPLACTEVDPPVSAPLVTMETVPEPPTLVPPRGPLAMVIRLTGSDHSASGGTSS